MRIALRISLLSVVALTARAEAQVLCALGTAETPYNSMVDMPPSAGAQGELRKLKALLCPKGCGKVFLFANATTPNTATVTDGGGASKITYSPTFVSSVQKTYGPLGILGILAHELGHHIDATGNRVAWMKESWDAELRADAWAGCALAKAELKPSGLQAALLAMWTFPSASHPPWSARRPAITAGYVQCGGRTLPPISKEETGVEAAKKDDNGGDRRDEGAGLAMGPGGCSGDRDCRNGRTCVNRRCGLAPARRRCGKDTDCPEPEECGATGYCGGPASQAQAEPETPKPPSKQRKDERKEARKEARRKDGVAPAPATAPAPAPAPATETAATETATATEAETLASLEEHRPPPSAAAPAKDTGACARSCDEVRNRCVEAATSEVARCLGTIQADPSYRACTCPNYPAGNYGCYRYCTNAYEQGKSCSAADQLRDCRSDGDRCRSQCS